MSTDIKTITIECLRYDPEVDSRPRFQAWQVPSPHDPSVLRGLQYTKAPLGASLPFRGSCRMAICGSCGRVVTGEPQLSCHTFLRDYYPKRMRIEPLDHFPIIRDL